MNTLKRWLYTAALASGLVLGPPLAYAAYIFFQEDDGAAALRNTINSTQVLWLGRKSELEKLDATRARIWELDRKEYTIHIAGLGDAASHYFVAPTTGVIESAFCTFDPPVQSSTLNPNQVLLGADTLIRLYSSGVGALVPTIYTVGGRVQYLNSRVTDFLVTMTQNGIPGTRYESTNFSGIAITQGQNLALETDGGTTVNPVARCTLRIRAHHA